MKNMLKKIEFEKKGIKFEVEVYEDATFIKAKGMSVLARPKRQKEGWGYQIYYNKKFVETLTGQKGKENIFIVHESAEEVGKLQESYKEQKKEEIRRKIISGEEKIKAVWKDGEYLSGWSVQNDYIVCEMIEDLYLGHWVEIWGFLLNDDVVQALGEEFTYQAAVEYARPKLEEIERKRKEEEEEIKSKFEEAKRTGKPVLLYTYFTDCNDPKEDCDMDQVTIWAMPDGTTKQERTHTY